MSIDKECEIIQYGLYWMMNVGNFLMEDFTRSMDCIDWPGSLSREIFFLQIYRPRALINEWKLFVFLMYQLSLVFLIDLNVIVVIFFFSVPRPQFQSVNGGKRVTTNRMPPQMVPSLPPSSSQHDDIIKFIFDCKWCQLIQIFCNISNKKDVMIWKFD